MEDALRRMRISQRQMDDVIERERREADEIINDLEDQKRELERRLETVENDLTAIRRSGTNNTDNVTQTMERLRLERESIDSSLARIANMKVSADTTIQSLEEVMDKLQVDDDCDDDDGDRMLSTIETAALLHGQIKVSLMLIETQLRNHVERLKHDEVRQRPEHPMDRDVIERLEEINCEALSALKQVESALFPKDECSRRNNTGRKTKKWPKV